MCGKFQSSVLVLGLTDQSYSHKLPESSTSHFAESSKHSSGSASPSLKYQQGGSSLTCLFMDVIMWRVSQGVVLDSVYILCYCASVFYKQNMVSSYVSKASRQGSVQVPGLFGLVVLTNSFIFPAVDTT